MNRHQTNEGFEDYNYEHMQNKINKHKQKREDGGQNEDFPRQINIPKNPLKLNEENGDFLENSLVLEVCQIDIDKKDMKSRNQLGFQRKHQQSSAKKEKKPKEQSYESLDVKATLSNGHKGLSNYSTKTEVQFKLDQGMPIPFIVYNKDTCQWQFSDQASEAIQQVKGPVSFTSIIGQPHSGKSTLLNLLMQDDEQFKYKFASQTDEALKGLVIWSDPTFNTQTGSWIFFVDSQDTDAGEDILKQQFIISCLISSVLIVNHSGKLSSDSLSQFSNLLYINELIEMEISHETNDELKLSVKEELSVLFPHMLYVLRDFQDSFKENGRNITWHQYLEHFLTDNQSFSVASPQNKKIISRIIKYFRRRDAHSMILPLKNKSLSDVMSTPFKELDETFQEEIKILRKKIIQYQQKKEFRGIFFSSNMSVSFISSIIEDLNQKKKINIQKAFEILIENEFIYVFNEAIDIYNNFLSDKFQDDQFKNFEVLLHILREAREQAQNTFYVLKAHDTYFTQKYFEEYMDKLSLMMNEKEAKIIQFNSEEQIRIINIYTAEKMIEIQKLTQNGEFKIADIQEILTNYEVMLHTVIRQCMGEGREKQPIDAISSKILKDMTSLIISEIQEMKTKFDNNSKVIQKELEQQIKQKDLQNANKLKEEDKKQENIKKEIENKDKEKKDIEAKLKSQQTKAKQVEDETANLEAELKKSQQELEALRKKGCCEIY